MEIRILPCLGTSSCPIVAGRRLNWWFPPRLVLLLPCQTGSLTVTSHPPLPMGDRIRKLILFSLPNVNHFLSALSPRPSSPSSGSPVRTKHTFSGQNTNNPSCLYLQFIFPLTGQVNVRLFESPSSSSLYTMLHETRAGTPLTRHTGPKKSKGK